MCQIHSTVECLAHISFRALNAATFLKVSGLQHLLYKATMKRIFENVAMSPHISFLALNDSHTYRHPHSHARGWKGGGIKVIGTERCQHPGG